MDEFSNGHAIHGNRDALPEPLIQHRAAFGTVTGYTADQLLSAIAAERERCARLVDVLAKSLDEHITGGIGDSARTVAKYIRAGKQVKEQQ